MSAAVSVAVDRLLRQRPDAAIADVVDAVCTSYLRLLADGAVTCAALEERARIALSALDDARREAEDGLVATSSA